VTVDHIKAMQGGLQNLKTEIKVGGDFNGSTVGGTYMADNEGLTPEILKALLGY